MCNLSAEGCTVKKEGGQIAPTRKEKRKGGSTVRRGCPWSGPSGSRRWCFGLVEMDLSSIVGDQTQRGSVSRKMAKDGKGQPSSFLVLSQIFTQSSMHGNPPWRAYYDPACNLGEGIDCIGTPGLL
jgi:hypothetical protein